MPTRDGNDEKKDMTVGIEKIKSVSREDADINLNGGHYVPLEKLIKERGIKRMAEIGCAYGNLAKHLLENTELEMLYSIDPYLAYPQMPCIQTQEDYDLLFGYVTEKMARFGKRFKLIRKTSMDALWEFTKGDFDMVFIDGNHTYDAVREEITWYEKLLPEGGILSGHDLTVFRGVDQAVEEYKNRTGKEMKVLPGNVWYFNQ